MCIIDTIHYSAVHMFFHICIGINIRGLCELSYIINNLPKAVIRRTRRVLYENNCACMSEYSFNALEPELFQVDLVQVAITKAKQEYNQGHLHFRLDKSIYVIARL